MGSSNRGHADTSGERSRFVVSRRQALGLGVAAAAAASTASGWSPLRPQSAVADAPPVIINMADIISTPPFSFTYAGTSSTTLLATWSKTTGTQTMTDSRIRHTATWTAPDGFTVQWIGDEYPGFTTLAWTVYFTNNGSANSGQLANVLALDVQISSLPANDWTVRTARGSNAAASDFAPLDLALPASSYRVFSTVGGRPTDDTAYADPGSSSWQYLSGTGAPGYLNSDQHVTSAAGARATFTFTGTSVAWIGPKNVDCGIAAVYLDGLFAANVDLYSTTWLKQQTLYTSISLTNAIHTLDIVNTGRTNASASGNYVSIDAFTYAATGSVTVDDTISGISYSGTWNAISGGGAAGYYQATQHSTSTANSSATFSFSGTSVSWIGPKNVDCGIANVLIDGVQAGTADLYATSWLKQRTLFNSGPLTAGSHTIQVVNAGTKNASSSGYYTPIDAFSYTQSGTTMVDDTSSTISYVGSWNPNPSGGAAGYYNSTQHSSSTANANASLTFTGTSVSWIGPKNVDCGIANVLIDGVQAGTVDLYATSWLKQQVLFTSTTLSTGSHTIKIVNTGTKNASATGNFVPVDAFRYEASGVATTYNDTDGAIAYTSGAAVATNVSNGWPFYNVDFQTSGLICALGWPGQWGVQIKRDTPSSLHLYGGMTLNEGLSNGQEISALGLTNLWLAAGETIRTPMIVLQPWNGGNYRAAQNIWRQWMLRYHVPRAASGSGPAQPFCTTQANDYFPGQTDTAQDELTWMNAYGTNHATAGTGGVQSYWWIDAGWYQTPTDWTVTGTWTPDPTRFPNGLKPVTDRARALGMQAIVWFEPERVMPNTYIANNYPSYLLSPKPGDTQWNGQAKLFNFGNPNALTWATNYFANLITSLGVDFYREDFNIAPLPFWQNADPADRQGLTQAHYVDGHLKFWAGLQAAHPGMLIDSCASGGRRLDIQTLQYAINLLRSDDVLDATSNQSHVGGLSPWVPLHGGALRVTGDPDDAYNARSGMGPVYHEALDITQTNPPWTQLKTMAAEWQTLSTHYTEDFYLLTPHSISDDRWLAWQFGTAASGSVQVFRRPSNGAASETLLLYGLNTSKNYQLSDLRANTTWTQSGSSLTATGLQVSLPTSPLATAITYTSL